jgi:DNA-binding transcriptional ArsR family regulator
MADEIRILDDPEKIKIAIDPTRRKILELLRYNDLTVSQLVGILNKDQSTIYRHVEKLLKADFIRQSGQRKEHHIPEKIYGRTAKMFFLAPGIGALSGEDVIIKHHKEMYEKTVVLLEMMGYSGTEETETAGNELYTELEFLVQSKIKELGPDTELDFGTLRRLRSIITVIEIHRNEHIRELAKKYADSFL